MDPNVGSAVPSFHQRPDTFALLHTIESSLTHLTELISLAHELACEMPVAPNRIEAALHLSGRLATLMHSAGRELEDAQQAITRLSKASR
jgi:hypothetical protein